ncbi:MAG: type IX secretion system sortase PorU [Bacteroidota bacterium]
MKTKFSLLFLFFILNALCIAQDVKVLSSNSSSLVIEYSPVITDTSIIVVNGQNYVNLNIKGTRIENINVPGVTQVPVKEINIGVPTEFGNSIRIISTNYSSLEGMYIFNPDYERDSISIYPKYSVAQSNEAESINDVVSFGEYGLVRSLPVQTIKIYPVQADLENNKIKILSRVVFSVNFSSSAAQTENISEDFLAGVVLNWDVAKKWGVKKQQTLSKVSQTLTAGTWYRFETPEEGIYKIDRNFLQGLGINVSVIDPRTIKIFGTGGYNLPENYNLTNRAKFEEVAIFISGEQDGVFDEADYILFYGRGPEFWEFNSSQKKIVRVKHSYSKKNYFWLSYGGSNGKRMSEKQSLNVAGAIAQQSTYSYRSYDKDSVNVGFTGRDYYGDELNSGTRSRTYITTLNGIVPSSKINYRFRLANVSQPTIPVRVEESGNLIYSTTIYGTADYVLGRSVTGTGSYTGNLTDERSNLKFTINSGESTAKVYIDYFEIEYQRNLAASADNLIIFTDPIGGTLQYAVTNFSSGNILVYDISDYKNVKSITGGIVSGGQITFQTSETQSNSSKYIALTSAAFKTPSNGTAVNIPGIKEITSGAQLIVISSKNLQTQAERYANYRASQSPYNFSSSVFYVDDILNEFSGGAMDPTAIRDFLKHAYDTWQTKPIYVLLLGDGDFDYFNTVRETADYNLVPTYQTIESLDELDSYATDDYYARVSGNDVKVDLALGRLCVQTPEEADAVIDKIIKYETGLEKGIWQTNITLVADDGPQKVGWDDGSLHTSQSETIANVKVPKYFNKNKLYLAAFPTVVSGLGRRKPAVNTAIIDAINNGTLILNYIGHGNPSVWAHESVFEKATTIPQIKNENYFFLTAATCDFGKYDDPEVQSSTELMINMENSGAIGAFTAARVVYANQNAAINELLYTNLFSNGSDNLPNTIGRAYFFTKQTRTIDNDEKFHLFCDPTIRLNTPILPAVIDSVNSQSVQNNVQINALGNVEVKGRVNNLDGTNSAFDGEAIVSVYDSDRRQELKEMSYTITLQGGLIYRGRTNVVNGEFEAGFVVPKDISYENTNGKITAYVFNSETNGVGYTSNILVGGTNPNAVNDGNGPNIEIYFDDINFENSYLVNPDFTLIAKLSDQTGLNTTGTGIGHKLEGIFNDDETNPIDLTNYFIGDLNSSGKSGVINYRFTSLEPGDYKIKIKAWDVFNNFSVEEALFTVVSPEAGLTVREVYNYPNPFSSNTTFTFQHNVASAVNVRIKVYTIAGRLIREIEEDDLIDKFVRINWDGRDEDGNQIANGTYLYKLIVESSDGNYKENVLGKLAVIR